MVSEVITGLSAIKTAFDLAKGLKDIDDATRRNAAVIELQEKILTAQTTQSELLERVSELEKEVTKLKTWDADKQRYELVALAPNVVAYAVKEAMRGSEPQHYLCANCYNQGNKSYLMQHLRGSHVDKFKCNSCSEEISINKGTGISMSALSRARERGRSGDGTGWMGY